MQQKQCQTNKKKIFNFFMSQLTLSPFHHFRPSKKKTTGGGTLFFKKSKII